MQSVQHVSTTMETPDLVNSQNDRWPPFRSTSLCPFRVRRFRLQKQEHDDRIRISLCLMEGCASGQGVQLPVRTLECEPADPSGDHWLFPLCRQRLRSSSEDEYGGIFCIMYVRFRHRS